MHQELIGHSGDNLASHRDGRNPAPAFYEDEFCLSECELIEEPKQIEEGDANPRSIRYQMISSQQVLDDDNKNIQSGQQGCSNWSHLWLFDLIGSFCFQELEFGGVWIPEWLKIICEKALAQVVGSASDDSNFVAFVEVKMTEYFAHFRGMAAWAKNYTYLRIYAPGRFSPSADEGKGSQGQAHADEHCLKYHGFNKLISSI